MQVTRRVIKLDWARAKIVKRAEGEGEQIVGYASVFYDGSPGTQYNLWDDFCERIMPGAFDRAIKEDDCRALFNHDPSLLLGRTKAGTCRLSIDAKGLRYEIDPPDTQVGRDVMTSIRRGDLDGSSFAFSTGEEGDKVTYSEEGKMLVREIHGCHLYDVSPVTYPAYEASTTGLRSAERQDLEAEIKAWRESRGAGVRAKLTGFLARARVVEIEQAE